MTQAERPDSKNVRRLEFSETENAQLEGIGLDTLRMNLRLGFSLAGLRQLPLIRSLVHEPLAPVTEVAFASQSENPMWRLRSNEVANSYWQIQTQLRIPAFEALERRGMLMNLGGDWQDQHGIAYSTFFEGEGEPYGLAANFPDGSKYKYEFGVGA